VGRITYAQEEVVFDRLGPQQIHERTSETLSLIYLYFSFSHPKLRGLASDNWAGVPSRAQKKAENGLRTGEE
jgi:hypothetical protein